MGLETEVAVTELVVVGIDGSPDSSAALRWALEYAASRQAMVRVVHVWTPVPWYDELTEDQRERLSEDRARSSDDAATRTAETLRDMRTLPRSVEAVIAEGTPGAALVELSEHADLLVVGGKGRGGFADPDHERIGATARYVTRHARCPVTVVGSHRRPSATGVVRSRTIPITPPVPRQADRGHRESHVTQRV